MSFTSEVAEELVNLQSRQRKSCCYRALLCGLMYGCSNNDGVLVSSFIYGRSAELAKDILASRFSDKSAEVQEKARCGRKYYYVSTASKSLVSTFALIDSDANGKLEELIGFRCDLCRAEFMRGVFLSSATVNDPTKSYHLEFSIALPKRADRLYRFLSDELTEPKTVARKTGTGIYYKSGERISDILYMIGASGAKFYMTDISIEREIRNNENRATNCVTRNISRSVEATRRQIDAIELLRSTGRLDKLTDSLRYTAELRLRYNSATLAELALLHEPSITKSGLNQRLTKILEIADDIAAIDLDKGMR